MRSDVMVKVLDAFLLTKSNSNYLPAAVHFLLIPKIMSVTSSDTLQATAAILTVKSIQKAARDPENWTESRL
jgi:hypothetical protein